MSYTTALACQCTRECVSVETCACMHECVSVFRLLHVSMWVFRVVSDSNLLRRYLKRNFSEPYVLVNDITGNFSSVTLCILVYGQHQRWNMFFQVLRSLSADLQNNHFCRICGHIESCMWIWFMFSFFHTHSPDLWSNDRFYVCNTSTEEKLSSA